MSVTPTPVYDAFWHFAAERQTIYMKRIHGQPRPWTEDPILGKYKFTNAYRAADRVSQYLINDVIYLNNAIHIDAWNYVPGEFDCYFTPDEVFFRTILFKMFNRIDTWEWLNVDLCDIVTTHDFYRGHVAFVLDGLVAGKTPVYTSAYMTPSPPTSLGDKKHLAHMDVLRFMLEDHLPEKLLDCKTMREGYNLLRGYPMIGDFLAYQFITDLNYSDVYNWSEREFVVPGPGALDGIAKCFSDTGKLKPKDIIEMATMMQEWEFESRGLDFWGLWGRRLQYIDIQNLFCEISKYSRVSHPEIRGKSGRTHIKAEHKGERPLPPPFFPPKWGINQNIEALT